MTLHRKVSEAVSPRWQRFAESIVAKAGIVDETTSATLVAAFAAVPRDQFVAKAFGVRSSEDISLPISYGQMMELPSRMARMLGLIGLRPGMKVLELGCGSGYLSAVMATAGARVYGVEGVGLLAQQTRKHLDSLGYQALLIQRGEGARGWVEHAPYDGIIVEYPLAEVPTALIEQLIVPGGKLAAMVGTKGRYQITLVEANAGGLSRYQLESCEAV